MALQGRWLLFLATFLLGLTAAEGKAASEEAVQVQPDGRLFVEDRPFFPLGAWWQGIGNPKELSEHGLNTGFFGVNADGVQGTLDPCQQAGVKAILYFQGAPEETVRRCLGQRRHPALLAWCLGDDLSLPQLPYVQRVAELVREVDKAHPTCGDMAHTGDTQPEDWVKFTPSLDVVTQYAYPIPHQTLAWYGGQVEWWQRLLGRPVWTFIQCFTWARTNQEMGWADVDTASPLPDPEQVRLLCYAALSQGARGLLFFHWGCVRGRPEIEGEVAGVAGELGMFEPFLAGGTFTRDVKTSIPQVKAFTYDYEGSKLLLLFKAGEQYHRYVDEGGVEKVKVWVDVPEGRYLSAYSLSFPTIHSLPCRWVEKGVMEVERGKMELTDLILLTDQPALVASLRKEHSRRVRQVCGYVVQGAKAQAQRVAECYAKLGVEVPDTRRFIETARMGAPEAEATLAKGNPAGAYQIARSVLKCCRRAVRQSMEYADRQAERAPAEAQKYRQVFWSLPQFFAAIKPQEQ